MNFYAKTIAAASAFMFAASCGVTVSKTDTVPAEINISIGEETTEETLSSAAVTSQPPTEPQLSEAEMLLQTLSLHEKVCQMFMVTPEQVNGCDMVTSSDETYRSGLAEFPVGGIVLFEKNLETSEQTSQLLADSQDISRESCGVGLFTAIDEEGGTVARAANKLGTTSFYGMRTYGDTCDTESARSIGRTIGADIGALGFNVDFAPVADVNINGLNELGSRIFSSDPDVVSQMVTAFVGGIHESGVCATLKHFPGLGAEDGNTHYDRSVTLDRSVDDLRQTEFVPFSGGIAAGADFVMVGHQKITGIGDDLPCDLSYTAVTVLLRGELGFEGLAVTDSQQMNTISGVYGSGDAAVRAISAGIDIVLMPQDLRTAVDTVEQAVQSGELPQSRIDESVLRILEKKYELGLI